MRTCPTCGAPNNPADDFCGNCGSYLGWSDGAGAPAAPTAGGSATAAGGEDGRRTTGPAEEGEARPAGGVPGPGGGPATGRTGAPPVADPSSAPSPPGSGTPAVQEPAPAQQPEAVLPVQPAKPVAPRPVVRQVAAPETVTGPPCPACGTPNPPGRRFCRRCASPLDPPEAVAPLPWWRTVWPFRRRVRAGSGRLVRLLVILAVVVALCAGAFLLLPAGRALFEDTRDKLDGAKKVTPAKVTASAQLPSHPASATTDDLDNRYWGAPGAGASVTYTFGTPFRLVDVIITNGASTEPEQYTREARALRMDMTVTSADGAVRSETLSLDDRPGSQPIPTGYSDVVSVRLVLRSVTPLTHGRHVALAEVEFFRRG